MPGRKKKKSSVTAVVLNAKGKKNPSLSQVYEHQINNMLRTEQEKIEEKRSRAVEKAILAEDIPKLKKLITNTTEEINLLIQTRTPFTVHRDGKKAENTPLQTIPQNLIVPFGQCIGFAITNGKSRSLDLLLEENAKPGGKEKASIEQLNQLLLMAAARPNASLTASLLKYGARPTLPGYIMPNSKSQKQITLVCKAFALGLAIINNNVSVVEVLLPYVDIVKWRTDHGETALLVATKYAGQDMIDFFLKKKLIDIEAADILGLTPLIWAACKRPEVVKSLLLAGASEEEFKRFNWSPLEPLSEESAANLRCLVKLKAPLKDLKEKIKDEKRKREFETIEKVLVEYFCIDGEGNISYTISLGATPYGTNMSRKRNKQLTHRAADLPTIINVTTVTIIDLVQNLQKNFIDSEEYLRERIISFISSKEREKLKASIMATLKEEDKINLEVYEQRSLSEIQATIEKALAGYADSKRDLKVEKEIAKIMYNFNNGLAKNNDESEDIIVFFDQYTTIVNEYYLNEEDKGQRIFQILMDDFLIAIRGIVKIFASDQKQDLTHLVQTTLRWSSKEALMFVERAANEFQETFKTQSESQLKALAQFNESGTKRFEEEVTNLEGSISYCNANAKEKGAKFSNFIQKVTLEKEFLLAKTKELKEESNRHIEHLKYCKMQADTLFCMGSGQEQEVEVELEVAYKIFEDLRMSIERSNEFLKNTSFLEERAKALNAAILSVKQNIDKYASHQTTEAARASEQLALSFEAASKALEIELARKIEDTARLEKIDALKAEKEQQKKTLFAKLEFEKKKALDEALLKEKKSQKIEELNTAISALTEDVKPKKVNDLALSSATDLLPKLTVLEHMKPLRALLEKGKLISNVKEMVLEHLIIERSALLCLTARLMDGIKDYPETALFSPQQAKKIRDVIFHYRADIFHEPNLTVIAAGNELADSIKIAQETNANIREMVSGIVNFMSDEIAQKQCKGNWELINAKLNSSLLNKILNYEEKPRTDLKVVLLRLNRAEEQLKFFESFFGTSGCKVEKKVMMQAIYSVYAEAGAFAADYRGLNFRMYTNALKHKPYDKYIEYGNDVRHGRTPVIEAIEASYENPNNKKFSAASIVSSK